MVSIFQAQLVDLKSELTETQAEKAVLEKEVHDQLLQLHAVQLQLHAQTGPNVDSGAIKGKLVSTRAWMEDCAFPSPVWSSSLHVMNKLIINFTAKDVGES